MSISKHIKKFQEFLRSKNRSDFTIVAYTKDLEQLSKYLEEKSVENISKKDLKNFMKFIIKEKKLSKKTASRKLNSIKTFYKFLLEQKITKEDPSKEIDHPEIKENKPRCLSSTEYKAIRDSARSNLKIYTMIEIMLQTGLRIGEVSRLKTEDIMLEAFPPKLVVKSNQSNPARVIDINENTQEVLRKYIKSRRTPPNDQGYLFNTRNGTQIITRNIRSAISRICKRSGVENVRVNDFRNTFICHQIENDVSLDTIAKYIGHRRAASTENYLTVTKKKHPGNGKEIFPL